MILAARSAPASAKTEEDGRAQWNIRMRVRAPAKGP
jgi:hypothetical protein